MRFEKGPEQVLRALASDDPERLELALQDQRESFRGRFGGYPEELAAAGGPDDLEYLRPDS